MKLVNKHSVVSYPEYQSDLDEFSDGENTMLLMHINVDPALFTAKTFQRLLAEWDVLRECIELPLYAIEPNPDDEKWERFVSRIGFTNANSRVDCTDGQSRRLFVSKKKNNEH